jgi:hypothetical protein
MCPCDDHVPDFSTVGFAASSTSAEFKPNLTGIHALRLDLCVSATYQDGKICFDIPVLGHFCVSVPVHIPIGASLKVCGSTCGSIIPTGVKLTLYVNNIAVYSFKIGSC